MAVQVDRSRYAHVGDMVVQVGEGADVDAALDDAVDTAHDEIGHGGFLASVADFDPGTLDASDEPAVPLDVALTAALRSVENNTAVSGVLYARQVAAPAAWRRRKVTVKVDDPDVEIGQAGEVAVLTPALESYIRGLLAAAGEETDGQVMETVEVRTLRSRWKPQVTVRKGKRSQRFVAVVRETGEVVAEGRTAGEARRGAVAVAKTGPLSGLEHYTLDIEGRVRLEEGPAIEVERVRIAQKGTLRVTLSTEKDPAKTKVAGWLFYSAGPADTAESQEVVGNEETPQGGDVLAIE